MSNLLRTQRSVSRMIVAFSLFGTLSITSPIIANNGSNPPSSISPAKMTASVPRGFEDSLIASIPSPTDLAFTPDGRIVVTSQPGHIYVIPKNHNNQTLPPIALNLSKIVCNNIETGLIGITVDPDFGNNGYLYIYYTYQTSPEECPYVAPTYNRVSRFILQSNNVIDPQSEFILIDLLPTPRGSHNGGGLRFGADGKLYVSVGDGSTWAGYSQSLAMLNGKILRINADGSIPDDNPFFHLEYAQPCGKIDTTQLVEGRVCQEIWAKGLRNPFRFTFGQDDAQNEVMYINDVGWRTWEEVNIGKAGADYGWPFREGPCETDTFGDDCHPLADTELSDPIYAYQHNATEFCTSITGGAVVPHGIWPESFNGTYLYGDFACGALFQLKKSGDTHVKSIVATEMSPIISMVFGPYENTQALYYTTYGPYDALFGSIAGGAGVRRMVYLGDRNAPPTANAVAEVNYSAHAPAIIKFNALRSRDPNGTPLRYEWDFGDDSAIITATNAIVEHQYLKEGVFTAKLTVYDTLNTPSKPTTLKVYIGNTAPKIMMMQPTANATFRVGQPIVLQADATDDDDGNLPDSALTWEAFLHHIDIIDTNFAHEHPLLAPTKGRTATFTAPKQEDIFAGHSRLEIRLTATDSQGLSSVYTQILQPSRSHVTFNSEPPGLKIVANSAELKTPITLEMWEGYTINLKAPQTQKGATSKLSFMRWENGNDREHSVVVAGESMTMTATYACGKGDCDIFLPAMFSRLTFESPEALEK